MHTFCLNFPITAEFLADQLIKSGVAAGTPILAEENIEDYFPLTSDFVKGDSPVFLLTVRGDSMINAGIMDRDYIVVRKQDTAINGEIVVALIENDATVKRFFKTSEQIKLIPENDYMKPIIVKEVSIIGKVIGVIRKYF
jgi:repressor LexA